ncbi:MAG: SRPBCC family protein [Acidimicrobiales bacterium]
MQLVIEHAVEIKIDRPVGDVFAFVTDPTNHPRWDGSSRSMQPDEPGPWKAGLTLLDVRRMGPRRMEVKSRVAALVPNESMDIGSITGPEFHGHWRLSPDGSGTVLRWSCEMTVQGPARLAEKLVARSFRRVCDQSFGRLKGLLEGGEGRAAP